jgi:hypothetical protein
MVIAHRKSFVGHPSSQNECPDFCEQTKAPFCQKNWCFHSSSTKRPCTDELVNIRQDFTA